MRTTGRASLVSTSRRSLMLAIPITLGSLAIGRGALSGERETRDPVNADRGTAAFPLVTRPGQHYLEDSTGKPFLLHGDTAWSLIADLTREDVDLYLDDRRARGFNTILVNLIEHRFSRNAPANAYGELPFHGAPFEALAALDDLVPFVSFVDYSAPNETYFAHADWVLRRAAAKGLLVLLTPSYLGDDGGADGWYRAMVANGPERMRQYGEYLGRRYRDFTNILWVHAGDYHPPRKDLVRAVAEGVQKFDPRALHTAHGAPERAAIENWRGEPWLRVNNIYTYGPVHAAALEQSARSERMPFFLIESAYENEHEADERRVRMEAYQAVLSGAAGHVFGNNPIWHFDGPGVYPAPVTWREALDSRGAQSMTHLHDLLTRLPWWRLEPDMDGTLLTDGLGSEDERAVAARATDGSLAVLYLPSRRDITVDLAQLAGTEVTARWYDPADGRFSTVSGSPLPATGSRQFTPKASNDSGFDDWVLVLESHA